LIPTFADDSSGAPSIAMIGERLEAPP